MDRETVLPYIDGFMLFCLCVLVIFLPIAHTETIRAFSFGIPLGLWIIKMILRRHILFCRTPMDIPLLLFTIVAGLSVITAVDKRYSLEEFIGEWVTGVFLFYLVVNNVRSGQMKHILGSLLVGNVLMVVFGIYDFFRDGGKLFDYQIRAGSLHSGFGTFSTYLVTVLPYLLIAIFFLRQRSHRLLLFVLGALNIFCLYITFSRGAWVAAAVLAIFIGWRFFPRRVFFPLLGLAGLALFLMAPEEILMHKISIPGPGAPGGIIETGGARYELTKFILERIQENPFRMLGFGRRSFVKKYKDFYLKYKGALMWHAHDTFLDLTLQTGVQGLVFFCFFLYKLLQYCRRRSELETWPLGKYYFVATFLMIIAFFVRNLSDDFFVDDSALLFWFLSGAVFALATGLEKKERKIWGGSARNAQI
jgi:O-antigen ligase